MPKVPRKEVLAYRDAHSADWTAKVSPGVQRLFYDPAGWQRELSRIQSLTGMGAEWRARLRSTADRIVDNPFPAYTPPAPRKNAAEGWQRTYGDSLVSLCVAASIWPEERYTHRLREMVLAGCAFDTWGREGKEGELVNMDLAAAHMARGIAMAYDWHRDLFSDAEKEQIRATMTQRMGAMLKGFYGGIFWASWYTQNHNHICMASLGLSGVAFLGEIPAATEWIAAAALNFQRVGRAMYPDGSIFEGVPYWGYGRSFILQYIEGTKAITGADELYALPMFRNSIDFRVGVTLPGMAGTLLWGDSRGSDSSGPQPVLYRLASQYQSGTGQYLANALPFAPQGAADAMAWSLLWYDPDVAPVAPAALDYHAPDWDVLTSRSGWGDGDYLVSLKSGYNQNHHTKIDAGSLSLNFGGEWLLMAPGYGVDIYGKPGFFDKEGRRWTFFSNSTESHSTLLINGRNQRSDIAARGRIDRYVSGPSQILAEASLTEAYSDVLDVRRRVIHQRGEYVLVLDEVRTEQPATVEWLAQVPPDATLDATRIAVPGTAGDLTITRIEPDAAAFQPRTPTVPNIDVEDWWMKTVSSQVTGTDVRLATLLQPVFRAKPAAPLEASVSEQDGWRHIRIRSPQWEDDFWIAGSPAASGLPGAEAVADLWMTRRTEKAISSLLASRARKITLPAISLDAESPIEVAWEAAPAGSILSLGTSFQGRITTDKTLTLYDGEGRAVSSPGALSLAAGTYYLLPDADSLAKVQRWAKEKFPGTPAPVPFRIAAPSAKPTIPRSVAVTWEAEGMEAQARGNASALARSEASGGKVLANFGSQSPAHSVTWSVTVPQDGLYRLSARYAVGQPQVTFAVLVDGATPSEKAIKSSVSGPAGWGSEKYWTLNAFQWRDEAIRSTDGSEVILPLSAGKHLLTFSHPSAGINIDTLTLSGTAEP